MRIIDADGHVQEKLIPWAELLEEPYRSRAPKMVKDNRGKDFLMIEGKLAPKPVGRGCGFLGAPFSRTPKETTGMIDPVQRLKDMNLEGIDIAVIFGSSGFLALPFLEDKDFAGAMAHTYNTWLASYCEADPRRLKGVALVPIQDPPEAVKELRRSVTELGFVAVATAAHSSSGKNLNDPDLDPFFATAESLNVPVCVHTGAGEPAAGVERFDNPFFTHTMTQPFEQMIGALCIVAGGVLERHPRLRVAFLEAGAGWVPYWMERLDEHYEYLRPTVPWLTKPPSEYMRSDQVFYSFEPDELTLNHVIDFVGEDRFVFASDYNHQDSRFPNAVKTVTQREGIPPTTMAKIMGENAARLYNLEAGTQGLTA